MSDAMWFLTRSTGIVATVLAVAALLWGFLFSARETGRRFRPAWWLDLHNWLGGLALCFVAAHVLFSLLDTDTGLGVVDAIVPGTAGTGIAWGVLATWTFVAAVFTTWPRRWKNRRWWRVVHLGSVVGFVLALVHAFDVGTDASTVAFRVGTVVVAAIAAYAVGLRVFSALDRDRA